MNKTSILIADDHSIMRMGLKAMLNVQPKMTVVGEAANGRQAVALAARLKPDVIIMDLMMPEIDGAEATERILRTLPGAKVIILTSFGNSADLLRAIQNGAVGIQLKEDDESHLVETIRSVMAGSVCIPADLIALAHDSRESARLTNKQSGIMDFVSRGFTNREIARIFGISEVGVQKHLKLIFAKLGAANRTEAIAITLKKQLLKM